MSKQPAIRAEELSRHLVVPVLVVVLMTTPWFFGGREPIGMLINSLLAFILFAAWAVVSRHQALKLSAYPRAILLPLAGLLGIAALSLTWSITRYETIKLLITLIQAAIILVVTRDLMVDQLAKRFIFILWTLVAFVVFLIGAFFFVSGNYERMTSLFYWANPLATYLLVATTIGMQLIKETTGRARQASTFLTGCFAAGLILTYSRAAWLIAGLLLVLLIAASQKRLDLLKRLGKVFIIAALIASLLIGVRTLFFKTPTLNIAERVGESSQSTSVSDRFAYWREATVMFADRPLTGWGLGTYREIHPKYQESPTTAGSNPHNSIAQVFVELGLVGVILYLVLIGGLLRYGWQLMRDPKADSWRQTAWLAVVAIGLHSWLDLVTNYPALILSLALFLALCLPVQRGSEEVRVKSWILGLPLIATAILLILSAVFSYQVYTASTTKEYIDAVTPFDIADAQDRYQQIFRQTVYDTDYLSYAAVLAVERFENDAAQNPASLNAALVLAQRAQTREPYDAKHRFAVASIEERQGRTIEALKDYRRATELDPYDNPQYQIAYAKLLSREGSVDEALLVLKPVAAAYTDSVITNRSFVQIKPRIAAVQVVLANLYLQRNDKIAAQASLNRARFLVGNSETLDKLQATINRS